MKKKFTKIILILTVALSLVMGTVSVASAETFDLTGIIDGTDVTVTAAQSSGGAIDNPSGLKIVGSKDGASASLVATFKGDFELEWSAEGNCTKIGTFRFKDVDDPTIYFDWVLTATGWNRWYSAGYIEYDGEQSFYSYQDKSGKLFYGMQTFTSLEETYGMQDNAFFTNDSPTAKSWFKWDNANKRFYSRFRNVEYLAFDAEKFATQFASSGKSFPGFGANGYTVEFIFTSVANANANVFIHSIKDGTTTLDLSGANLTEKPACVSAYENLVFASITTASEITYGIKDVKMTIPSASCTVGGVARDILKIEIEDTDGELHDVTETLEYTPTKLGTYYLIYTACEDTTVARRVKKTAFKVEYEDSDLTEWISGESEEHILNEYYFAKNTTGKVDVSGRTLDVAGGLYGLKIYGSSSINAEFTGALSLEFGFDLTKMPFRQFTIRITDAEDETNYLDYMLYSYTNSGAFWTMTCVRYSKDTHANMCYSTSGVCGEYENKSHFLFGTCDWGQTVGRASLDGSWIDSSKFLPSVTFDPSTGVVKAYNKGVTCNEVFVPGKDYILANRGAISGSGLTAPTLTGFEKYNVSFLFDVPMNDPAVFLYNLNGIDFTRESITKKSTELKTELIGDDEISVEASEVEYVDAGARTTLTYEGADGMLVYRYATPISSNVDLTKLGEYEVKYSDTVKRTVNVVDTTGPIMNFKNGISKSMTYPMGSETAITVSAEDVIATDIVWGNISAIAVEIKKGEGEYQTVSGTFNVNEAGTWTARYSATDGSGNVTQITRTLAITDVLPPVITVNGTVSGSVAPGTTVTIPTATALDGAQTVPVTVVVRKDNVVQTVSGNTFVATVGTWTITYYAVDASENTAYVTLTVVAEADVTAPVISVTFETTTATKGETVTIPTATATDNTDGNVSVTVEVTFAGESVEVSGGTFKADKEGNYSIRYSAVDQAGNLAERTFEITVSSSASGGCGCGGTMDATLLTVLFGAVTVLIFKKKII